MDVDSDRRGGRHAAGRHTASRRRSSTPGVNPITFSDDGRLFVAQCFFGDKLYEVDPLGVKPARVIREDLGPGCGLNGMDWGPDDRLYGPRWFRGEVVSIDVDSGDMRTVASGFEVPAAVKFDNQGRLNVLDTMAGKVIRVEGDTTHRRRGALAGPRQLRVRRGRSSLRVELHRRLGHAYRSRRHASRSSRLAAWRTGRSCGSCVARQDRSDRRRPARGARHRCSDGDATFVARNILGVSELGSSLSACRRRRARDFDVVDRQRRARAGIRRRRRSIERHKDLGEPVDAIRYGDKLVVSEYAKHRVIALEATV